MTAHNRKGERFMNITRFLSSAWRRLLVTMLVLGALVLPATALAGAEQFIDTWENAPTPLALLDPCTGEDVSGVGIESGIARATFPEAGVEHVRVQASGRIDLYDGAGAFAGTWAYHFNFESQVPPDRQGIVHALAVGSLQYADGRIALVQAQFLLVFEKGEIVKRAFQRSACGG
jgi:hypothetical protein